MKLKKLLNECEYSLVKGSIDIEIKDIIYDSRAAGLDTLFICIPGSRIDSHDFIGDVIKAGCRAIVVSRDVEVSGDVTLIRVSDPRLTLALASCALFDYPSKKMKMVGITGTKGKTTTSYMIKAILEAAGKKTGLIGTNGIIIGEEHFKTKNTTPESYELQKYFAKAVSAGCEYMIMEVSSQGLKMNRVSGIVFDVGIFMNITPDHIGKDEHADFEEYLYWKSVLLTRCKKGLVNADDPHFSEMIKGHTCELFTYGLDGPRDFSAEDACELHEAGFMGTKYIFSGREKYETMLGIPGGFNVYNALAAAATAELLGIKKEAVTDALRTVRVNGRMQLAYVGEKFSVIIDYAHNGVSANSMLRTLRSYNPRRLVVVFGCGGDRDPHRRYEMGEAVGRLADFAVITNDNPRFEDPANIIKDIHIGLDPTGCEHIEIPDRPEAIAYVMENAHQGDVIAIIGKGHEDYQEVRGVRTHLSDAEEVQKNIVRLGL